MPFGISSERAQPLPDLRMIERRKRPRESVRLPVLVFNNDQVVECLTDNVSSEGMFFRSEASMDSGSLLTCFLKIPRYDIARFANELTVVCRVRVLRSDRLPDSDRFGIACRIEEYHCTDTSNLARSSGPEVHVQGAAL